MRDGAGHATSIAQAKPCGVPRTTAADQNARLNCGSLLTQEPLLRARLYPYRLPTHAMIEEANFFDADRYLRWMHREVEDELRRARSPADRCRLRALRRRVERRAEEYDISIDRR